MKNLTHWLWLAFLPLPAVTKFLLDEIQINPRLDNHRYRFVTKSAGAKRTRARPCTDAAHLDNKCDGAPRQWAGHRE